MTLEGANAKLGGELLARFGKRVDDGDQLTIGGLSVFLRVKPPQIARADDCRSDFAHDKAIMPLRMPTPPRTEPPDPPLERDTQLRDSYFAQPWARRELIILAAALLWGLIPMPLLIWVAGNRVLGPYTHGQNTHAGPFALLADFFVGLAHGSAVFWAVALGPAVLLVLLRLFLRYVRAGPSARAKR